MKKFLMLLLIPFALYATDGDTLEYSTRVESFADGDTFFTDIHWHPMKDTIQSIINGRLGNVNIAADAEIEVTKLDTTGTLMSKKIRGDTVDYDLAILDTLLVDSGYISILTIDTAMATHITATIVDINGGVGTFTSVDADTIRAASASGTRYEDDGGNLAVFIEDGGSVGLGFDTPNVDFHIGEAGAGGTADIKIEGFSSTSGARLLLNSGHTTTSTAFYNSLSFYESSTFKGGIGFSAAGTFADKMSFIVGGDLEQSPEMVIQSDAFVGIDTVAPGSKLHVAGSIRARDTLFAGVYSVDTITATIITADTMYTTELLADTINTSVIGWGTTPDVNADDLSVNKLNFTDLNTTLRNDSMWAAYGFNTADTEGAAALDTLSNITTDAPEVGWVVIIRTSNDARDIFIDDGAGNINIEGDFTLDDTDDKIMLINDGSSWSQVSRSNNQ